MALSLEELDKGVSGNPQYTSEYCAKRKYYLKNKEKINEYKKEYMREYMRENRKKQYCETCQKEVLHLERHKATVYHARRLT